MRVIRDCEKFPRQLLISFLLCAHWVKTIFEIILISMHILIVLTGSNNQFQKYESWILTIFLSNKIAFDKKVITNGKISENLDL